MRSSTAGPDLIDLSAPRGQNIDVCRLLKSRPATRLIPVVIVTSQSKRDERLSSIEAGCDDFISKPFDEAELGARVRSLVRLKHYTDELETAETVMLGLGATIEARDPCSQKVEKAMHERKRGTLRSGGSGKKVTSRKQAIAIGLSEARRAGGKVPRKRKGGGQKRKGGGRKK